jgi:hypothetical protein
MKSGLIPSIVLLGASCASVPAWTASEPTLVARSSHSTEVAVRAELTASSTASSSATSAASRDGSRDIAANDRASSADRTTESVRGPRAADAFADVWAPELPTEVGPSLLAELATTPDASSRLAEGEAPSEKMPDRFMIRGGLFYFSKLRTKASLDLVNAPVGAVVDFNRTLGLDSSDFSGRVDARYRFNDSHAIGASWYRFRLSGSRTIDKDIVWDGVTYPVNAQVDTFFNQDIYELNYRYSIYHNADIEFGVSAGFNVQHFSIGLSSTSVSQSQSETLTAPLPVFGAFVAYNFTPRLLLQGQYEFFFLDFDKASGQLQDFFFGLEYRIFKNMAFGGAFDLYTLNANYETSTTIFDAEQTWHALMLYATIYF